MGNNIVKRGRKFKALVRNSAFIPDWLHGIEIYGKKEYANFPEGGIVECKAPEFPIQPGTSDGQILEEISLAVSQPSAYLGCFKHTGFYCYAGKHVAGTFTLVLPFGAIVSDNVIEKCDDFDVNLFVQYAFINVHDQTVLFSNPVPLHTERSTQAWVIGITIANRAVLKYTLLNRWKLHPYTNPTNNSADD